jgi:hypothetical protein
MTDMKLFNMAPRNELVLQNPETVTLHEVVVPDHNAHNNNYLIAYRN